MSQDAKKDNSFWPVVALYFHRAPWCSAASKTGASHCGEAAPRGAEPRPLPLPCVQSERVMTRI